MRRSIITRAHIMRGAHARSRLTYDKVAKIRERLQRGDRVADIAADFGVDTRVIYKIKINSRWRLDSQYTQSN